MIEPATPVAATTGAVARGQGGRWGDLAPRLLTGLVMMALAFGSAVYGGALFALFWLLASIAIGWEWQRLIGAQGAGLRFGLSAVALTLVAALAIGRDPGGATLALAAGAAAVALAGTGQRGMAALGVAYAGAPLLAVVVLRSSPSGLAAILWLFAVVWGTDVMAYFGGRLIGGPKLWPRLSPSKTWSGFGVGVVAGALAGLAVAPGGSAPGPMFLVGLTAAILAQAGDFFESGLKRRYGVKDTSNLIPGHGGVMDRLDGFVAAAVFALCLGAARAGLDAAAQGLFHWP